MPRAARSKLHPHQAVPSEPLTLDEIDQRYDGKWVLIKVTEMTPLRAPAAGVVVAAGTNRDIFASLRQLLPNRDTGTLYYKHKAGPWVRSLDMLERYRSPQVATDDESLP